MTYYTSKCPHCGAYIKIMSRTKYSHGSPFKICNKCGQTYVDPNCYEEALKPYKKSSKFKYGILSFIVSIFISGPIFLVLANISSLSIQNAGIISGVAFLLIFVLILSKMLSNYETTEAEVLKEWQESDRRLKNPDYVKALVKAGFDVPETYKVGIVFEKEDPYEPNPNKFICTNCGTYSSGWHQTCPKCGATGKMEKTTDFLQKQAKKKRDEEQAKQLENERARKKYICKQCGVLNSGWYQTCPNCGAVGKMELVPKESPTKQVETPANSRPQTEKRFICRGCGKISTGWYQNCPNCGVAGKMEAITVSIPPVEQKEEKQTEPIKKEYCRHCGKPLPSKATRCIYCGETTKPTEAPQSSDTLEKQDAIPSKIDTSLSEQLRQLKALFDDGIITQEEFDAKKKQLLGL